MDDKELKRAREELRRKTEELAKRVEEARRQPYSAWRRLKRLEKVTHDIEEGLHGLERRTKRSAATPKDAPKTEGEPEET